MTLSNLDVRPMTPVIGAEINGVDLSQPLADATFEAIRDALHDHLLIVLPGQDISPADQLAFARRFGEIEPPHPVFDVVEEQPEITVIQQDGSAASLYNDVWHTDVTFRAEPAMASILYARALPESGGDTVWSSLQSAWRDLSPGIQELIEERTAIHDYYGSFAEAVLDGRGGIEKLAEDIKKFPPIEHPVVRTHPATGRKGLFVNRGFTRRITGLSDVESKHLLEMLVEHSEHPNHQVRHRWRPGDLAMWDNRATMHLATSNFSGLRLMHRITVQGDRPYH